MIKIAIFALSMFLPHQEETISEVGQCDWMTFSDALPVQFWLQECDTFNEHEAQGVHHVCWCQPWNCDDDIVIQFKEDSGLSFTLAVINQAEPNDEAYEAPIYEVANGVYQVTFSPGTSSPDFCDSIIQLKIKQGSTNVAKSDCLDLATSHDETILMQYSNHRNFDGLVYEDTSPDLLFSIRVPCRFFHEVEPEEDEAMELTSSILTTSAQVKTQRLLEIKHVPYYFHKKLRRVLKHQNLTIFDKAWKKEEKYEVNEGRKTWPLKSATCLLTEKNSVVRNIL